MYKLYNAHDKLIIIKEYSAGKGYLFISCESYRFIRFILCSMYKFEKYIN